MALADAALVPLFLSRRLCQRGQERGESQKQRSGGGRVRVIQGRGIGGGQAFGWSASELTERGGTAKPIARGL